MLWSHAVPNGSQVQEIHTSPVAGARAAACHHAAALVPLAFAVLPWHCAKHHIAAATRGVATMPRCYYDVLGIPQNADETAIKKAYRLQALQWHPGGLRGCEKLYDVQKGCNRHRANASGPGFGTAARRDAANHVQ